MTSSLHESLAELDDALAIERDLLDRMRFKLVVMRLFREGGSLSDRDEAQRQLERAVNAVRASAAPHLRMISELAGSGATGRSALVGLVEIAPEPYRTMLADHVAWFTALAVELECDEAMQPSSSAGADQMTRELDEVLYRAARGALSGGIGLSLARYLRGGIRGVGRDGA